MTVMFIPIELIDPPDPILRKFSEQELIYLELVEQIRHYGGPFQAPPARPRPNGRYQLVDGYRRYLACKKVGILKMPLRIIDLNDVEYIAVQIACNSQHKETDWIDFAFHLEKLRHLKDEEMSLADMAILCDKSTYWLRKVLQLNHLDIKAKKAVQRNEIPLGNAYWLARLPLAEQIRYIDEAMTMPVKQFTQMMRQALQDYREAVRQGKLDKLGIDRLRPMMRDLRVIESELKKPSQVPLLIVAAGIENPIDAANLALQWAFRVDKKSLDERNEKMQDYERYKVEDAMRREQDRDNMRKMDVSY